MFAACDEMALGAVEAIEEAGKSGEIIVVGLDGNDDAVEAVEAGKIIGNDRSGPGGNGNDKALDTAIAVLKWRGSGKDHLHTVYNGDQS